MTAHGALRSTVLVLFLTALAGCGGSPSEQAATPEAEAPAAGLTATATLASTSGSSVTGTVTFTQQAEGVLVFAMISGLAPGPHGFHIHENGDCSSPDGSSAGAHFNPAGASHGGLDTGERHAGDMGNIIADQAGSANYEQVVTGITLEAGPNSIVGRSVVVHADPDDMSSQPAGNAGARLACGVIEAASH